MLTIDAHLDLGMNAMEWNRDLRQPVEAIREREKGLKDLPDRGRGTVSFPALRKGEIGLVVATQIARFVAPGNALPGWHSAEQAWAQTQGQLAWYRAMENAGELFPVTDLKSLETHLQRWERQYEGTAAEGKARVAGTSGDIAERGKPLCPIGYIRSLEGADSLVDLDHLHVAYKEGLRAIGPAHYGPGRYANGTDASGRLSAMGRALLKEMNALNMILDVTHLCDDAFWDAMELYDGPIWASHNNCRTLVPHNRQFSDEMIGALIEKNAVIGGALDAWMLVPDWIRGQSTPKALECSLSTVADHMDHICQLAGNADHIGIGTDLDGAFGTEQCPYDLDTIADLQQLPSILAARGYTTDAVKDVMSGNWLRFLRNAWRID